jgi:hypothetical protein
MYVKATGCPFPVYADPSRRLYAALGMARTLRPGAVRPQYQRLSMLANGVRSIVQGLRSGRGAARGGDVRQVGGEFLFVRGGTVAWCHRMRNTRDHTEVAMLKQRLFAAAA